MAGENFAYGGASVGPNLGAQLQAFGQASAGRLGDRAVASLWFGANDVIAGVQAGAAEAFGTAAANGVAAGALALSGLGVSDVMIFNLPSLDQTPRFNLFATAEAKEAARLGTLAFNATLDSQIDELRDVGVNVIEINMFTLFNSLVDDPERYGVADATTPCLLPGVSYCGPDAAAALAFFDPLHPNATIHSQIADVVRGEIAPVPLPAPALLLVGAIAALAAVRARRQGSRIA